MYIYATDYDGTVTFHGVTDELKAAIARFRAQGNYFGIVTGRPYVSIKNALDTEKLDVDFVIANNGAVIADGRDNILYIKPFGTGTVISLINYLSREEHDFFRIDVPRDRQRFENVGVPHAEEADGGVLVDGAVYRDVTEVTAKYRDYAETLAAAERIHNDFSGRVRALIPGKTYIDFVPEGVSKADGIRRVAGLLGITPERVYATGDSHNDLDMLTAPDIEGYAVVNALDAVKEKVGRTVEDPLDLLRRIMNE